MAIEIEKKYKLRSEQRESILKKLKEINAEFSHEDFEINELYSNEVLKKRQAVLRIRKVQDKTILTYKQRVENDSAIKHQIEHETEIEDAEAVENIIQSLGFTKSLVYEKRRQTWQLDNIEIVIDELPFGFYMEIEGSPDEIKAAESKLGAENLEAEHETYPRLTLNLGKQNGEIIEARFAEFS